MHGFKTVHTKSKNRKSHLKWMEVIRFPSYLDHAYKRYDEKVVVFADWRSCGFNQDKIIPLRMVNSRMKIRWAKKLRNNISYKICGAWHKNNADILQMNEQGNHRLKARKPKIEHHHVWDHKISRLTGNKMLSCRSSSVIFLQIDNINNTHRQTPTHDITFINDCINLLNAEHVRTNVYC